MPEVRVCGDCMRGNLAYVCRRTSKCLCGSREEGICDMQLFARAFGHTGSRLQLAGCDEREEKQFPPANLRVCCVSSAEEAQANLRV